MNMYTRVKPILVAFINIFSQSFAILKGDVDVGTLVKMSSQTILNTSQSVSIPDLCNLITLHIQERGILLLLPLFSTIF